MLKLIHLFFLVCPEGGGDKEASCDYWKKLQFCKEEQGYYEFMKKTCPASCGICQGVFLIPKCGQVGEWASGRVNEWAQAGK